MDPITPDRWRRIEALLDQALERPPEEREAFLDQACADDAELRRQVEAALEAGERPEPVLEEPGGERLAAWLEGLRPAAAGPQETVPERRRIGPYRLLRPIGRGGMGQVYLARRDDQAFRRHVALKVIRRGIDTEDVLRRFRTERQILASLHHPNIAQLFDGGATDDGLSYFVMEYIDGVPITDYCDRRRLPVGDRLRLFLKVGAAVSYAHRNLVVHRDLKPSNILVTGEGEVKLLDFGIAKILNPDLPGYSVPMTRTHLRVMTPEFASPEQVRGETITTASDVYSLGLLLYLLLAGHHPHKISGRSPTELEREICETEPEPPSTVVRRAAPPSAAEETAAATPEAIGRARRTQTERLRRRLAGDLDKIVLMALRKEPDRRYSSVEALLEDIERHLGGLPVNAQRPTLGYRSGKFVRRHRFGVAAAALVALSLLAGIAGTAWQARVATAGWSRARLESAKAEQVKDFLIGLFEVADPSVSRGAEVTARELLDRGSRRIEEELEGQPEVRAEMLHTMGVVYRQLGLYEEAEPLLERSLAMRRELEGPGGEDLARSLVDLAWLRDLRGDYDRAETLYREALAIRRQLLGPEHPEVARILDDLSTVSYSKGAYAEAEELSRQALDIRRQARGSEHLEVAESMSNLAVLLHEQGRFAEAERMYRDALAMQRRLLDEESHEAVALSLVNLGSLLYDAGRHDEAEAMFREGRAIRRQLLGADHPLVARSSGWLARALFAQGKLAEAEDRLLEALTIHRRHLGDRHPYVARDLQHLGRLRHATGNREAAARLLEQALEVFGEALPPDHPFISEASLDLGRVYREEGRFDRAEPLLLASHAALAADPGAPSRELRETRRALYDLYTAWGKPETAATYRGSDDPPDPP